MKKPHFIVSYPPHWHCGAGIASVMYGFVLALMPTTLFGVYLYGMDAARVISLAIVSCVVFEALSQLLFRKPTTVTDGSAVLNGLLLGLILPPSAPFWLVIVGAFVCILVGKQVYGGLGSNPFNAVLVGWAALKISWKIRMDIHLAFVNIAPDAKYPLDVLWQKGATALGQFSMWDLFVGREIGGIGCASDLLLLAGGLFLIARGLISWRIPVSFLVGVAVVSTLFRLAGGGAYAGPLFHVLAGNTMIGAFFLATDYASSPVSKWGMVIFGLGCGMLTVLLRVWSGYADGTFFAILLMNMTSFLLDMVRPRSTVRPVAVT
ncbi:MAG: RnfABCDGE type electron transport complex subunit D [Planctomycetes bacterium]|nr:RnfABCDGE type electron transport complex subunit D [Planctomycetota bacterium]